MYDVSVENKNKLKKKKNYYTQCCLRFSNGRTLWFLFGSCILIAGFVANVLRSYETGQYKKCFPAYIALGENVNKFSETETFILLVYAFKCVVFYFLVFFSVS